MEPLHNLTVKKIHEGLQNKAFSATEITREYLTHIKNKDAKIGAFLKVDEEGAIKQAENIDAKIAAGENINPLSGVPTAIKDAILVEGLPSTSASKMLENYTASYDATVIKKLKEQGVIILGKTNMDEFAMGASNENSAFKPVHNPHDLSRVPGGSSGGSAAAVASNMVPFALGSDTGGSIRQPAGLTGVVGFKPTYGAVSRFGLMAMASSLDQIGPFAKTVEDATLVFDAIKGADPMDATSVNTTYSPNLLNPSFEKIKELTVGIPKEYFIDGTEEDVRKGVEKAIEKIKSLKINIKEISLPSTRYALPCYYIIMPAEVSSNLARYDGIRYATPNRNMGEAENLLDLYLNNRGAGFGTEPKRRIILGTYVLSSGYYDAYYGQAQKVRALIKKDFDEAFSSGVDVMLTPVSPTKAFKIGEKADDPIQMYLSDIFTVTANLAGVPALSLPVEKPTAGNLPVGFQLIGRHFREEDVLGLGMYYERICE